jgi:hypothetical protein
LKETITESKAKQQYVLGRTSDISVRMIYDQTVIKMWHIWKTCHICELQVGAAIHLMYDSKNKDPSLETRLQECGICWRLTLMFIRINALQVKVNISG